MTDQKFEKIYKDTYDYLLKFIVIKCYNINDVNDIIQDTYIELYKILKKNKKQIQNMDSFICGIAINIIKRYYYKKNKIVTLLNNDEENDISIKIDLLESVMAPINKGDVVGKIMIIKNGEIVSTNNIICQNSVEKAGYIDILNNIVRNWKIAK